jgi:hypothetical protein
MTKKMFASLLMPVLLASVAPAQEGAATLRESSPRSGLPNFLSKTQSAGVELKVAYLGGSITAQPGWRPKSLALLQKTFPAAKFSEINAAIGGTGSDLGVFRLWQDVLEKKPDLLFVEFAVNDGGADPGQIVRCMEGIVRQTWKALPGCDICFVYTITEALAPEMLAGGYQRSASTMEKVADHYGIPTIHLGVEVIRLAKEGRLLWKAPLPKTEEEKTALGDKVAFAPDSVHPHVETGHQLYLDAIVRSLPSIQRASNAPSAHSLPPPLEETNYESAKLIPIQKAGLSPGFAAVDTAGDDFGKRWASRLPNLHKAATPGDVLTFKFKGTRCSIYDIIGPDCGQVIVTLDDKPTRVIPRFDSYCTYHRLATLQIGSDLPDVVHSVKIELHPEQPDKAKILSQRNQKMDKPERFDGRSFYPGAILLVGDLEP